MLGVTRKARHCSFGQGIKDSNSINNVNDNDSCNVVKSYLSVQYHDLPNVDAVW